MLKDSSETSPSLPSLRLSKNEGPSTGRTPSFVPLLRAFTTPTADGLRVVGLSVELGA